LNLFLYNQNSVFILLSYSVILLAELAEFRFDSVISLVEFRFNSVISLVEFRFYSVATAVPTEQNSVSTILHKMDYLISDIRII
jgi:hypothetical protein